MADEAYWSWKPGSPTPTFASLPEGCFKGTQKQFEALSPGMRREIVRDFQRRARGKSMDQDDTIGRGMCLVRPV